MFFFFFDELQYKPYLCIGTFFTLIIGSLKPRSGSRMGFHLEYTDGMGNTDIFYELQKIADSDLPRPTKDSYDTVVSNLKNCKTSKSEYFDKDHLYRYLNERLIHNNKETLNDISLFLDKYIEGGANNTALALALVWLISTSRHFYGEISGYDPIISGIYEIVDQWETSGKATTSLSHLVLFCLIATFNPSNKNNLGSEAITYWKDNYKEDKKIVSEISASIKGSIMLSKKLPHITNYDNVVVPTTDVIPELTPENIENIFVVASRPISKKIPDDIGPFSEYLNKAIDEYSKIKTLLYKDEKKPFYDFYIPNDLNSFSRGRMQIEDIIDILPETEHVSKLHETKIIITGIGGAGKSMMMHHTFMQASKLYSYKQRFPVLIELKNYKDSTMKIIDLIYSAIQHFAPDISEADINDALDDMILLFDGLDEIRNDLRDDFLTELTSYRRNGFFDTIVISSRPYSDFIHLRDFNCYDISPFTKEQSISMIEKLEFHPDAPEYKTQFLNALETKLFRSHKEFVSNPLLLTIMLMTYQYNGDISSSTYGFYQEAYETLVKTHDATKPGFKRKMATNLDSNEFSRLLSAFCSLSYINNCYDYSQSEIDEYWTTACKLINPEMKIKTSDFIHDISNNICLMFYESGSYHYIHRSFQEYFSAVYFSRCEDTKLIGLSKFSDNCGRQTSTMLNMLYAMIPEKIEKYIFYPYLSKLISQLENTNYYNDGFLNYLGLIYPTLYAKDGDTDYEVYNNPRFFFYEFLIDKTGIQKRLDTYSLPILDEYEEAKWYYAFTEYTLNKCQNLTDDMLELLQYEEIPSANFTIFNGDPEYAGTICAYELDSIFEKYIEEIDDYDYDIKEIMDYILSDSFALRNEYNCMLEYYHKLNAYYNDSDKDDSMYGLF